MVLLCPSAFLCFIELFCMLSVTAERRLLCSSEHLEIWYTVDGPLYYLSMTGFPCNLGVSLYSVMYRVIPMFTISRVGYHGLIYYKDQLWLDHVQPDVPCEDIKLCYIIKEETLHETFPFYVKKVFGPEDSLRNRKFKNSTYSKWKLFVMLVFTATFVLFYFLAE